MSALPEFSAQSAPDAQAFMLGQPVPDVWTEPWYKVDAVGDDGRCSFGLPTWADKKAAFARMAELQAEHPEYTRWAVLKFQKFVHVTKEEPDVSA